MKYPNSAMTGIEVGIKLAKPHAMRLDIPCGILMQSGCGSTHCSWLGILVVNPLS
jgi:hypothetical protein